MAIVADLDTLKAMLGVTSSKDDALLQQGLDAAHGWAAERIYVAAYDSDPVQEAILLIASRLYKRRLSPEGVAGWADLGVVRIVAVDPDVERLLEHYYDLSKVGIA